MKSSFLLLLILSTLFSVSSYGWDLDHREYKQLSLNQKVRTVKAYKEFLAAIPVEVAGKKTSFIIQLIAEAYAAGNYNCFYAGWPSEEVGGKCTNPANKNSDYTSASCGASQLQCQPILFGEGLCANTSTQRQRNTAFSQCETKFQQSGKKVEEIAIALAGPELANKAQELFSTVERICSEKKAPSICRSLKMKVDAIKKEMSSKPVAASDADENEKGVVEAKAEVQVVNKLNEVQGTMSEAGDIDCDTEHDHSQHAIRSIAQGEVEDEEVPEEGQEIPTENFERISSRYSLCVNHQSMSPATGEMYCLSNDGSRPPAGYTVRSKNGHPYFPDYNPTGNNQTRQIDIRSADHALNDTFIYLGDYSGGPDSHDVKTMMFLIPRRNPPVARVEGDNFLVKLQTGEEVVFDAKSGAVKSGALREGAPDFNPNRHARRSPNVHYSGAGISIRLDHRYSTPTDAGGDPTAEIKQGSKSCEIPRGQLFNDEGKLKTSSDADLLSAINRACPGKGFSF